MPPRFDARRVVLLDLDGTLVDSAADIAAALNRALADAGLAPFADTAVRAMIGDGARVLVERALAQRPGAAAGVDATLEAFRLRYEACCLDRTACFGGMAELVRDLAASGRTVAVVTNKPSAFAAAIVRGLGLADAVAEVVGPERVRARKPAPEHVLDALALVAAAPGDAVMVGDGPTDVAAGRDAGVATIAVTWGYRPRAELEAERPDAWADDVPALRRLLLENGV